MAFFFPSEVWFLQHIVVWSTVIHDFRKLPNFEPRPWNMLNIWWCNCTRRPRKLVQIIQFCINLLILFWECKVNSQFFTQLWLIVTWITATLGKTCVFFWRVSAGDEEFGWILRRHCPQGCGNCGVVWFGGCWTWGSKMQGLSVQPRIFEHIEFYQDLFSTGTTRKNIWCMLWAWFALFSSVGVNTLFCLAQFLIDQTIWITGQVENATGSAILWNGRVLHTTDMKASVAAECRAV